MESYLESLERARLTYRVLVILSLNTDPLERSKLIGAVLLQSYAAVHPQLPGMQRSCLGWYADF